MDSTGTDRGTARTSIAPLAAEVAGVERARADRDRIYARRSAGTQETRPGPEWREKHERDAGAGSPLGIERAGEDLRGEASAARIPDRVVRRQLHMVAATSALIGAPIFLLGVILHPGRDGASIAAVGDWYGVTHGIEAMGLVLVGIGLIAFYALAADRLGTAGLAAFLTAVAGTVLWFGLIAVDGTRNPVTARQAPAIVHTTADLDPGAAILSVPALLVFPIGYALLALVLARHGMRWPGLLIGAGALVYWSAAIALFAFGPLSSAPQILEIAGALPYALGFVLLSRWWGDTTESGLVPSPAKAFE